MDDWQITYATQSGHCQPNGSMLTALKSLLWVQILVLLALHHYYFGESRYLSYIQIKILCSSKWNQTRLEGNTQEKTKDCLAARNRARLCWIRWMIFMDMCCHWMFSPMLVWALKTAKILALVISEAQEKPGWLYFVIGKNIIFIWNLSTMSILELCPRVYGRSYFIFSETEKLCMPYLNITSSKYFIPFPWSLILFLYFFLILIIFRTVMWTLILWR